jgi:hypothetical protein
MKIECAGTIRGNYLCTHCMGARQPEEEKLLFIVVIDDDRKAEEYYCEPCMNAVLNGAPPTRLRIEP